MRFAQDAFDTPWRIWLDSDILFLDAPSFADGAGLEGTDFHARFEFLSPALTSTNDTFAPYWSKVCELCDVRLDEIGFHELDMPPRRMKPYFNSGFFLWRAETDFAEVYVRNFYRILRAKIAPNGIGPWFADQVSLTPTVAALNLRWRMLSPQDHLMLFVNALENRAFLDVVPQANLVHYSKSRNVPYRSIFDPLVIARRPELADILHAFDSADVQAKEGFMTRAHKFARRLRQAAYVRNCRSL